LREIVREAQAELTTDESASAAEDEKTEEEMEYLEDPEDFEDRTTEKIVPDIPVVPPMPPMVASETAAKEGEKQEMAEALPFGGPGLLQQARDLVAAIEALPASEHASNLTALVSDAAFGLQNLQMTGEHFWPKICKIDWHETAASVLREILKAGADENLVEVAERRMKLIAKMDQMIADDMLAKDKQLAESEKGRSMLAAEVKHLHERMAMADRGTTIPNGFAWDIYMVCESVKKLLLEKNAAYGRSRCGSSVSAIRWSRSTCGSTTSSPG